MGLGIKHRSSEVSTRSPSTTYLYPLLTSNVPFVFLLLQLFCSPRGKGKPSGPTLTQLSTLPNAIKTRRTGNQYFIIYTKTALWDGLLWMLTQGASLWLQMLKQPAAVRNFHLVASLPAQLSSRHSSHSWRGQMLCKAGPHGEGPHPA